MKSPQNSCGSGLVPKFTSAHRLFREHRAPVYFAWRLRLTLCVLLLAAVVSTQPCLCAEMGDDNPTGVAGIYNGQITTAGNYDPYTGNAVRTVDDIVVPGSVGAYPL